MKSLIRITLADLGAKLAEYCVTQGMAEDVDDDSVVLNAKGIEMLSGPPYYFDLDIESDDDLKDIDLPETETTFTWYQKNFSPGKKRITYEERSQNGGDELHNWRPGLSTERRERPPMQQFQQRPHFNKNFQKKKHTGKFKGKPKQAQGDKTPIKFEVNNLPPIARTGYNNKYKKNNHH